MSTTLIEPTVAAAAPEGQEQRVFATPETVLGALSSVGYFTDRKTATSVWLSYHLDRPILQEGPAGAGKTQLALAIAKAAEMDVVRLQCYPGITDDKAIGHYNQPLQELFVLLHKDRDTDFAFIQREVSSRRFFQTGPLLEAIESPRKKVLLIDEVDKVPESFEAMLLELLSEWDLSTPGLGTIHATTRPLTFLTSNRVRELSDPLRRRSIYLVVQHPTTTLEGKIVASKTPSLPVETHLFIASLAKTLRVYPMRKPPSISEMKDIATAMELLGLHTVRGEHEEIFLPLIAKWSEDVDKLKLNHRFEAIVSEANYYVDRIKLMLAVKRGLAKPDVMRLPPERVRESEAIRALLKRVRMEEYPNDEIERLDQELEAAKERH